MKDALPQTIYLKDYKVSPFLIETTDLVFDLGDQQTCVTTRLVVRRNPASAEQSNSLELNSKGDVQLQWIEIDEQRLNDSDYTLSDNMLILPNLPASCVITTEVLIQPQLNTSMMGYIDRAPCSALSVKRRGSEGYLLPRPPRHYVHLYGQNCGR